MSEQNDRREQNKKLTERWFQEVWNEGREESFAELLHPDVQAFGYPNPESVANFEQYKQAWREFRAAFSELHVTLDDMLAEGNRVALRYTIAGKHTGDGLGFPATGEPVQIKGSSFALWSDGKITHGWNFVTLAPTVERLRVAAQNK